MIHHCDAELPASSVALTMPAGALAVQALEAAVGCTTGQIPVSTTDSASVQQLLQKLID